MRGDGHLEETSRVVEHALAEQRASHLQHEVVIVVKPECQNAIEAGDRRGALAELEQHLAQADFCRCRW